MEAALDCKALDPLINFLQNQNELSKKIEFNLVGSGYLKEQYMSRVYNWKTFFLRKKWNVKLL